MLNRHALRAGCLSAAIALSGAAAAVATAATGSHPRRVSTHLKVLGQAKPACHGKVCTIRNHGTGTMSGFGRVTFTTVITDDTSSAPCPGGSYVPHMRRTLTTSHGTLVLNEAGFVCVQPGIGPRVDLVWVADAAASTGAFAGVHGTGTDHAYLARNTAAETGTILLHR